MQHVVKALSEASPRLDFGSCAQEPDVLLSADKPAVTADMARSLAEANFGVKGDVSVLTAERDANFIVTLPEGSRMLLKITNDREDRGVTGMQTAAMMHLAAVAPDLPVQRIFAARDGSPYVEIEGLDGHRHVMRLISFIEGAMLHKARPTPILYPEIGRALARITLALRGFFHPSAGHVLQWDIKHGHRLWSLLPCIENRSAREKIADVLRRFDEMVAPRLPLLRAQIVHNDFNPYNLVVDGEEARRVIGVIDFGDMVHTPLVCDLAVACSYHLGNGPTALDPVCALVAGYHSVLPLEEQEIALLPDLIALRNAATLAITAWRAAKYPDNGAYILRNAPASIRGLDTLAALGSGAAAAKIRQALAHLPEGDRL
jgi:hydroxylysine kinase